MANKDNKIEKFTKNAIGKTLNKFNKEIGMADLVDINKNQDRILNGILSQVNDENIEKTEKSSIITLDNSTDGIVELQEIQGDTNVNVSKIVEETILPLEEELVYLKNSTKYYIQFNSTASGTVVFNLGGTEETKNIVEGYNNIAITTPAETSNLLTIDGQGIKISEVVVSESVCGGHYLGLQSCFEEHMENGKYVCTIRGIALDGSKVNGIKLYLDEPLRGIGDVKDRLCIKDGKLMVERNCASVTLDGSEDEKLSKASSDYDSTNNITFALINISNISSAWHNSKAILSSTLSNVGDKVWGGGQEGITSDGKKIIICLNKAKLQTQDVAGFKQYLQQNPTTVVYQLAEPTYEEVTNEYGLPIVLEGYENGIVYIDSAVIPTTSIKYTSNNVLATILSEVDKQNTTTQEDINMNIVTYMMDIDMLLTEKEMENDISVMAVNTRSANENMLDRMSDEDKKVYRDNTVLMLEKMITAKVLDKNDINNRLDMYLNNGRISQEQYDYLKTL